MNQLGKDLDSKISFNELYTVLQDKADKSEMFSALLQKANTSELENIRLILKEKSSLYELEEHISNTKKALEAVSIDMMQKAGSKDVCTLIDTWLNWMSFCGTFMTLSIIIRHL